MTSYVCISRLITTPFGSSFARIHAEMYKTLPYTFARVKQFLSIFLFTPFILQKSAILGARAYPTISVPTDKARLRLGGQ